MEQVQIFDTTLRDGEQSPGFSMNREEKLKLAHMIEELGVDVLEAGFPIASPGDLEATRAVAAEIKHCRVAALARAVQEDVGRCAARARASSCKTPPARFSRHVGPASEAQAPRHSRRGPRTHHQNGALWPPAL